MASAEKPSRLFCSDLCVLEMLCPDGVPDDTEIFTESPNIHLAYDATSLNDRVSPMDLVKLSQDLHKLCIEVYEKMHDAGFENESYAIMFALTCEQNFLKKAASLKSDDFEKRITVTKIEAPNPSPRFSNDYEILFRDHKDYEIRPFKTSELNAIDYFHRIEPSKKESKILAFLKAFASNVSIYPFVTPLWPFLKRFWLAASFLKRPGVALIEESQIIRSICVSLSLRGYSFEIVKAKLYQYIDTHKNKYENDAARNFSDIRGLINNDIQEFLKKHVVNDAISATLEYLLEKIEKAHKQYYISYKSSYEFIECRMNGKRAVLSNMLKSPTEYGFAFAAREKGIKVLAFQHGICREISPHFDFIPQITESNIPHYFLTSTKKSASVSVGYPFTKAETIPVGMTKDHYSGHRYVPHPDFPEIFYISTNVYTSNAGFIKNGGDDKMAALSEINTIQNVLAKVKKNILYKAYPTQKYLDPDPCYNEVQKHKNLKLYFEDKDLRYLSKHARVLVSSKATSTFNWCFLTDKPLVFFDHPHLAPLRKELVPVFKDMLFYFDLSEYGVEKKIVELLNKPVEEIEKLYNLKSKKLARQNFINEYYCEERSGAEKRATQIVLNEINI